MLDAVADVGTLGDWTRPWLAGVAAALLIAVRRLPDLRWRGGGTGDSPDHAHQVTILPPPEVDPHGDHRLVGQPRRTPRPVAPPALLYGTPHIAVEYRWTGRHLTITLWVPGTVATGLIAAAVRAAWPGAACTVTDAHRPLPIRRGRRRAARLVTGAPGLVPA